MRVTCGANIRAATIIPKMKLRPGRTLALESGYAHIEHIITWRSTVVSTTKILLNRYRVNGTAKAFVASNRSWKLSKVGRRTRNGGGKSRSSSSGLNAVKMTYTIGSMEKTAIGIRKRYEGAGVSLRRNRMTFVTEKSRV